MLYEKVSKLSITFILCISSDSAPISVSRVLRDLGRSESESELTFYRAGLLGVLVYCLCSMDEMLIRFSFVFDRWMTTSTPPSKSMDGTVALFNDFTVQHIFSDENTLTNDLVQKASSFWSNRGKFGFLKKLEVLVCQTEQSGFWPMHSAIVCSAEPSSAKPNAPVSKTGGSRISRISDEASKVTTIDPDDWRTPLVCYLKNTGHIADRKVRWQALKYIVLNNTLYCWTIDGLLLKYLGSDQSKIAMGEVHEGICGTH
jgi:hypothetical protein